MDRHSERKIVLITQKTRLEELIYRYNTAEQAQFFIEHSGGDFGDYQREHERYMHALHAAADVLGLQGRVQQVERSFVPNFIFGKEDVVVVLGRDGLVANTLKYLSGQRLIGVNPDPLRWDGVLLPFQVGDLAMILPEVLGGGRRSEQVTLAQATLSDGQCICAVNDLFIGQKSHVSALYEIALGERRERQCSSGVIVSTGMGKTGWLKSIVAGAGGIGKYFGVTTPLQLPDSFRRDSNALFYTVREPYESRVFAAQLVFGKLEQGEKLEIVSNMAENGVIFSDGMESDYLQFNAGTVASIGICENRGSLVV